MQTPAGAKGYASQAKPERKQAEPQARSRPPGQLPRTACSGYQTLKPGAWPGEPLPSRPHTGSRMSLTNLDSLFSPKAVAVIGAANDPANIGHLVMKNLMGGGFPCPVMPVSIPFWLTQ